MLIRWSIGCFIIALFAGVLGFGGIASDMAGIARVLFALFLVVFLVTLMAHLVGFSRR